LGSVSIVYTEALDEAPRKIGTVQRSKTVLDYLQRILGQAKGQAGYKRDRKTLSKKEGSSTGDFIQNNKERQRCRNQSWHLNARGTTKGGARAGTAGAQSVEKLAKIKKSR